MTGGDKLFQRMNALRGATAWDSKVAKIQTWFYGSYIKASWCATTVCYCANQVGLKLGKHENVKNLMDVCQEASKKGYGAFYSKDRLPTLRKGDILFWLWSGSTMKTTSSKHVGVCERTNGSDIYCLGGNQSGQVRTTVYDKRFLYAVYRPW